MKYDNKNSIGGRFKQSYEYPFQYKLPERMPVIIRLDGRAFHTLTKKANKLKKMLYYRIFLKNIDARFLFFSY